MSRSRLHVSSTEHGRTSGKSSAAHEKEHSVGFAVDFLYILGQNLAISVISIVYLLTALLFAQRGRFGCTCDRILLVLAKLARFPPVTPFNCICLSL